MGYVEESASLLGSPEFEGCKSFMYRDTAVHNGKAVGNVTVGVGELIPDADAASRLPFQHPNGAPATVDEIKAEYKRVLAMPFGHPARFYRRRDSLMLPPGAINDILLREVKKVDKELKAHFSNFATFPKPAKLALLDMAFNLGAAKFLAQYRHHFIPLVKKAALNPRLWKTVARHYSRRGPSDDRNTWTIQQFNAAANVPPTVHLPGNEERPVHGSPALPVHPAHMGSYRRHHDSPVSPVPDPGSPFQLDLMP